MSLCRKEATTHQGEHLTEAITLARLLSIKLVTLLLVSLVVLSLLFYSMKNTQVKKFSQHWRLI